MTKRKWTSKVVPLDRAREKDEALFLCMFPDCGNSFTSKLPRRKNATEDVVCPRCARDFFIYWKDNNEVITNHGYIFYDMLDKYIKYLNKKSRRKK